MTEESGGKYKDLKGKVESTLTNGEKELLAAQQVMTTIKTSIAEFQEDCTSWVDSAQEVYDGAKEDLHGETTYAKKAGALVKRVFGGGIEVRKKRLDSMFGGLVNTAERLNENLGEEVGKNRKTLDDADETVEDLIAGMKECQEAINAARGVYKESLEAYKVAARSYNEIVESVEKKRQELLTKKEAGEATSALMALQEEVETIAASQPELYGQYNRAMRAKETSEEELLEKSATLRQLQNQAEFLSSYRNNMQTMVSEGGKFHRQMKADTETLKPLFQTIKNAASLVEQQKATLDAREAVRKVANASLVGIANLSKALTTRIGEVRSEKFIEGRTMKALAAINEQQKVEIKDRDKELMNSTTSGADTTGLFKPVQVDDGIIELEETKDGSFKAPEPKKVKED